MRWKDGRRSNNIEDRRGVSYGSAAGSGLDEALTAASAIGDDRLQRQSQGTVTPDTFTHGTSAQRVRWFKRGFTSGTISECDTFDTHKL